MSLFSKARKSLVEGGKEGAKSATEAAGTATLIAGPQRREEVGGAPSPRRPEEVVGATAHRVSEGGDSDVIDLDALEPANDLGIEPEIPIETQPVSHRSARGSGNDSAAAAGGNAARSFAMADAIRLLKALPAGPKVEMVVRLVRVTLGAANVGIADLSEELEWKETVVEQKIARLQAEADDLEKQLQTKRSQLAAQQAEAKELNKVRGRLNMAMSPAAHRPPPIPAAAIKRVAPTGLAVQGV